MIRSLIVAAVIAAPLSAAAEDKAPSPEEQKAAERKLVNAINSQGPGIDRCVGRYTKANPEKKGTVDLALVVLENGKVESASPSTSLPGARNLRSCLETVGKLYALPPPNAKKARLTFNIPIHKGAKFKMYVKGEAPKPKEAAPQPPIFQLLPRAWNKPPKPAEE